VKVKTGGSRALDISFQSMRSPLPQQKRKRKRKGEKKESGEGKEGGMEGNSPRARNIPVTSLGQLT